MGNRSTGEQQLTINGEIVKLRLTNAAIAEIEDHLNESFYVLMENGAFLKRKPMAWAILESARACNPEIRLTHQSLVDWFSMQNFADAAAVLNDLIRACLPAADQSGRGTTEKN